MPYAAQDEDLTLQYRQLKRTSDDFRPVAAVSYLPGSVCKLAALDSQPYWDQKAIVLTTTSAAQRLLMGVVAADWPGFNASIGAPNYLAPGTVGNYPRGSTGVKLVIWGEAGVLIDQSGSGAATITNEIPVIPSRATAGYGQGVAAASESGPNGVVGIAHLPASGIGSSLTAASLAQASQTATVATPASGDTLNLTIQTPYTEASPGILQTTTWSLLLNSTTAASATTAAAAMVAFLNAQPSFSQWFIATNVAGVITVTVNALSNSWLVTGGSGLGPNGLGMQFSIGLSGMVANSLTFACSVTGVGGTAFTAGSTTFASGTGYKGLVPCWIDVQ
jgi:hypothetical protein